VSLVRLAVKVAVFAAALAAAPAGALQSGGGIRWARDFEAAKKEASDRNVPLVIIFIQDGEAQNEQYSEELQSDKEVLKISRQAVFVIASRGSESEHKKRAVKERGVESRSVCGKFGEISCLEHQRIERQAFLQYTSGEINTPHTFVCDPQGKVVSEEDDYIPTSVLLKMVQGAISAAGKGISEDDWVESHASFSAAEEKWKRIRESRVESPKGEDLPDAIRLFGELADPTRSDAIAMRARARLEEIEALGDELRKDAELKEERKLWAEAIGHYRTLVVQWKGTRLEKAAKAKLRELEDRPDVKEALRAGESEAAARRLLDAAEDQIRRRQHEGGIRGLLKIVSAHRNTAAGAAAQARLEELRADPEVQYAFRRLESEDARRLLGMGENYARNGLVDQAIKAFESVIEQFPQTDEAKKAAERIAALKK